VRPGRAAITAPVAPPAASFEPPLFGLLRSASGRFALFFTAIFAAAATAAAVVAGRWDEVVPDRACGAYPLRGLMVEAGRRALEVELVDLRNSGDTAGDHSRVVGYGAFAVG